MYKPQSLKIKNIISFREQEFEFRNGKAVMIVGKNLDDNNQNGNGSGKSSLIESIALAFTGSSIRDVKTKELINNDAESGEVDLTMVNTVTGEKFRIWRKIYSNTKSAEYKSWVNDVDQADRYSDANMFNQFVWDSVGISKEDFFNFFLITKENYTPFLLVGDTKKKEIINRFSGADKVDVAFPLITSDSEKVGNEIVSIQRELDRNLAKQETLSEQIVLEEEKVSPEKQSELIAAKEKELSDMDLGIEHLESAVYNAKNDISECEKYILELESNKVAELLPFEEQLEIADLEVQTFEYTKDYDSLLGDIDQEKMQINKQILAKKNELLKVKDQFAEEIQSITTEEVELNKSLDESERDLEENELFESSVQKQLMDTIECPKCSHHFSLKDKNFNYEEAKAKLPEVQNTIAEYKELIAELKNQINSGIQQKKVDVNNKVIKAGEDIKKQIETLNGTSVTVGQKALELNKEKQKEDAIKQELDAKLSNAKRSLTNKQGELENGILQAKNKLQRLNLTLKQEQQNLNAHIEMMSQLAETIEKMKSQEIDRSNIVALEKQITDLINSETDIKQRLEEKRKEKEEIDAWDIHFKGFKSHLANKSIKNIQDYTNLFLERMGSNLAINIDGYKTLSNKKIKEQITTNVLRDGFDAGSYGKFSGGERGRIDICSIIAMQELISLNAGHGKGLDMLLADEILESIDVTGMEGIVNSLQSLAKTIMLVSQNDINSLAEYTLTVQKKNRVSSILN